LDLCKKISTRFGHAWAPLKHSFDNIAFTLSNVFTQVKLEEKTVTGSGDWHLKIHAIHAGNVVRQYGQAGITLVGTSRQAGRNLKNADQGCGSSR
jgi:hypothetical protein